MGLDIIRQIDKLDERVGGRFKLTALLQRRIQETIKGSPRFVEARTPLRSALAEVEAGKIELSDTKKADEE